MQFGRSAATFNVVPVDYVVAALAVAGRASETAGETLHLVDPDPLTTRELVVMLSREYAHREPRGRVPPRAVQRALRFRAIREAFGGAPPESIAYLNHPVSFDTRRAVELLAPHDLRPPKFGDYVAPMVAFFREHSDDESYSPRR